MTDVKPPAYSTEDDSFFIEEEEESLADTVINDVKKAIWDRNQFEFVETASRNVLLCGRSRSGKTTAVGVLKDPCYSPKKNSIFADTADARFQTFSINDRAAGSVQKFTLNIVDTPGLFEVTSKDKEARTDEVLVQTIAKCLDNEITFMSTIIMFATFEAGIHPHDIEAMKKFLSMFGGSSGVRIALCITHADVHPKSWRDELVRQLMEHQELSQLISSNNMEILFMGCTDAKSTHFDSANKLKQSYVNTYKMRETMLQFIFGASQRAPLKEMKIATAKIEQIKEMMLAAIAHFRFFLADKLVLNGHEFQQALAAHKEAMRYLYDNQAYVNVGGLSDVVTDLTNAARKLKASPGFPAELKPEVLWPLQV